jgi:hypothetical protein
MQNIHFGIVYYLMFQACFNFSMPNSDCVIMYEYQRINVGLTFCHGGNSGYFLLLLRQLTVIHLVKKFPVFMRGSLWWH